MSRDLETKLPIFIEGAPEKMLRSGDSPEDRTFNFLENAKTLMQIESPASEFKVTKVMQDDLGFQHIKLQQQYNGVPIYGTVKKNIYIAQ